MSQLPFPEKILTQHSATLGKTGSGKSSAMRVIFEHLLDRKKRIAIIDPKGDWWGLKTSADGKSAGYPVIAFGNFKEPRATDVPIDHHSGKHVAELIASGNRPCIIGFRGWMPAQMTRFWIDFAPTLFNSNEGELYLGIDEIQNFAAKGKIMDPEAGKCLHWTNRMMAEGRGIGLTFHIASQRAQKVHNDTLDCCETLIAMRTAHPAARQSIKDWIDGNGDKVQGLEVLNTMAQMKRGEAWVWSPENQFGPKRVQFPMFRTFDSFAPPQLQKTVSQSGWSEVDLDAVKAKLATVIAEAKANDPKEMKAEINRLRAKIAEMEQIKAAPAVSSGDAKIMLKKIRGLHSLVEEAMKIIVKINAHGFEGTGIDPNELTKAMEKTAGEIFRMATVNLQKRQADFDRLKSEANRILEKLQGALANENIEVNLDVVRNEPVTVRPALHRSPAPIKASNSANEDGALGPGERAILTAVAQYGEAERDQLTVLTGYKRSSRDTYLQRLSGKGYVQVNGKKLIITQAGADALGPDFEPLPTGRALYEYWNGRLSGGELEILRYLVNDCHGENVRREELDGPTGYKRSSRDTYIQRLTSRRLVLTSPGGMICAAPQLFDASHRASA
jgi:hypothetical protein